MKITDKINDLLAQASERITATDYVRAAQLFDDATDLVLRHGYMPMTYLAVSDRLSGLQMELSKAFRIV